MQRYCFFMEKPNKESTKKTYRSNEVVDLILSSLGLTRESISTYKEYSLENGRYIRLRISNHGIYLQNWFNANKMKRSLNHSIPKLNIGQNLAITFAPNQDECKEMDNQFPPKIKNVTKAKTEKGNNVKPQFTVRHLCYYTWKLSSLDIQAISNALSTCITVGNNYVEPLMDSSKYIEWEDTSNIPPKKKNKQNGMTT